MKKIISFLLAMCCILGITSCSSEPKTKTELEPTTMISEFIERYKRADISTVVEDPAQFVTDAYSLAGQSGNDYSDGWETNQDIEHKKETVLFNLAATCYVYTRGDEDITAMLQFIVNAGEDVSCKTAFALIDYMFVTYNNPEKLSVGDNDEATEHDFRDLMAAEKVESFNGKWDINDVFITINYSGGATFSISVTKL